MSKLVAPMQSIDTVHRSALTYIPFQITAARTIPESRSATDQIPAPQPTNYCGLVILWLVFGWFWVGNQWLTMLVCGCRFTVRWIVLHPSFLVIPFIGQTYLRLAADCAFGGD